MVSEARGAEDARWAVANVVSKARLERNRKKLLPLQKLESMLHSQPLDCPEWRFAVALWVEELGGAFGMPREGHVFQAYNVMEYRQVVLDERNAAQVLQTLVVVCAKALKLLPCGVARTLLQDEKLPLQMRLWRAFTRASYTELCDNRTVAILLLWKWQWRPDSKEKTENRRTKVWEELARGSELLMMQANVLNWSSECEEQWLYREAKQLVMTYKEDFMPQSGKRKMHESIEAGNEQPSGRKKSVLDVRRQFLAAVEYAVQKKEFAIEDVKDMPELTWASRAKRLAWLRRRLEAAAAEATRVLARSGEAIAAGNIELAARDEELRVSTRKVEEASIEIAAREEELHIGMGLTSRKFVIMLRDQML